MCLYDSYPGTICCWVERKGICLFSTCCGCASGHPSWSRLSCVYGFACVCSLSCCCLIITQYHNMGQSTSASLTALVFDSLKLCSSIPCLLTSAWHVVCVCVCFGGKNAAFLWWYHNCVWHLCNDIIQVSGGESDVGWHSVRCFMEKIPSTLGKKERKSGGMEERKSVTEHLWERARER